MNYRVEFLAEDRGDGTIASALDDARFPTFLHAVAAARSEVKQWDRSCPALVVVNIFDRWERLTDRVRLAIAANGASAR